MLKLKFCTQCGHKFEYKFAPPNFCPSCGTSTSRAPEASFTSKPTPVASEDDEIDYVPHIDKLKAKVEFENNVTTLSFDEKRGFYYGNKKFDKRTTSFDDGNG